MANHTPGPWYFELETMQPMERVKCPSCEAWRHFGEFSEPSISITAGGKSAQDYENNEWICGVGFASSTNPIDLANAHLIVAAPDMLAALRAILPYAESRIEDMEESAADLEGWSKGAEESAALARKARDAFDAAKAAIAKAEGAK